MLERIHELFGVVPICPFVRNVAARIKAAPSRVSNVTSWPASRLAARSREACVWIEPGLGGETVPPDAWQLQNGAPAVVWKQVRSGAPPLLFVIRAPHDLLRDHRMAVREYIHFAGDLFPNDSLCWKSPVIDGGEYAGDDDPRLGRSCRRGVHASSNPSFTVKALMASLRLSS
jgi:hypothetical protein